MAFFKASVYRKALQKDECLTAMICEDVRCHETCDDNVCVDITNIRRQVPPCIGVPWRGVFPAQVKSITADNNLYVQIEENVFRITVIIAATFGLYGDKNEKRKVLSVLGNWRGILPCDGGVNLWERSKPPHPSCEALQERKAKLQQTYKLLKPILERGNISGPKVTYSSPAHFSMLKAILTPPIKGDF
uniref:Uncharacterized protein n=1 Tax=Glossina pallidipes TaxID=7398 RepID=A0A1B0AGS9_GLOPL